MKHAFTIHLKIILSHYIWPTNHTLQGHRNFKGLIISAFMRLQRNTQRLQHTRGTFLSNVLQEYNIIYIYYVFTNGVCVRTMESIKDRMFEAINFCKWCDKVSKHSRFLQNYWKHLHLNLSSICNRTSCCSLASSWSFLTLVNE